MLKYFNVFLAVVIFSFHTFAIDHTDLEEKVYNIINSLVEGNINSNDTEDVVDYVFISEILDYYWISKFVFGKRRWKNDTAEDRELLAKSCLDFVVFRYGKIITKNITNSFFKIRSIRKMNFGNYIADIYFTNKAKNFPIKVQLGLHILKDNNGLDTVKIYDIIIENISMIVTEKINFSNVNRYMNTKELVGHINGKLS